MWAPVGPQLGKVGPQMGPGWADWGPFRNAAWVLCRGPDFFYAVSISSTDNNAFITDSVLNTLILGLCFGAHET